MDGKYSARQSLIQICGRCPTGATGKYLKGSGSKMLFLPLSGNPRIHDTVTGQLSGAASTIYEVEYNDRKPYPKLLNTFKRHIWICI